MATEVEEKETKKPRKARRRSFATELAEMDMRRRLAIGFLECCCPQGDASKDALVVKAISTLKGDE